MVDEVHLFIEEERLGQVVIDEEEPGVAYVLDVLERAGVEVVNADHPLAALQQVVAQARAQKAGPACDQARADAGQFVLLAARRITVRS